MSFSRHRRARLRRCVLERRSYHRGSGTPRRCSRNADRPARREHECALRNISVAVHRRTPNVCAYRACPRPEVRPSPQDHHRPEAGHIHALPARAGEVPRGCQSRHSASTMCPRGGTTGMCHCARSLCLWPLTERIDSNLICWF